MPGMDVPAIATVDVEWLAQHGHLQKFLDIRQRMLHKDYQPTLAAVCKKAGGKMYFERSGTTYQFGVTTQPHRGASSSQISPISRAEHATNIRDDCLGLMEAVSDVMDDFMPEMKLYGRRQNQLANASLLPGGSQNTHFTSMQANYSDVEQGLGGIKKFGALHPDTNDFWSTLTGMVIFSNTDDETFSGFLNITSLGVVIPMAALMFVFFEAKFFHVSTGQGTYAVPAGDDLRIEPPTPGLIPDLLPRDNYPYRRLTIPLYADRRFMIPRFSQFNKEIYTWEGRKDLGGKALLGRRNNMRSG